MPKKLPHSRSAAKRARPPSVRSESICAGPAVTAGDLKVHPVLKHYFGYCFYKAAMRYKASMEESLAGRGINASQLGMLRILSDMGAMSQNELGSGMGIDKATFTKWVDPLDRAGLVTRKEGAKDRRVKTVAVTKAGEKLVAELTLVRQRVEDEFLSRLSAEERAVLRSAIPKLL